MVNQDYEDSLRAMIKNSSALIIDICRAWNGEHFGEPGYGDISFVFTEIKRAEKAIEIMKKKQD
jgi:hypothetical protein